MPLPGTELRNAETRRGTIASRQGLYLQALEHFRVSGLALKLWGCGLGVSRDKPKARDRAPAAELVDDKLTAGEEEGNCGEPVCEANDGGDTCIVELALPQTGGNEVALTP